MARLVQGKFGAARHPDCCQKPPSLVDYGTGDLHSSSRHLGAERVQPTPTSWVAARGRRSAGVSAVLVIAAAVALAMRLSGIVLVVLDWKRSRRSA
jgi:hypothetical protein